MQPNNEQTLNPAGSSSNCRAALSPGWLLPLASTMMDKKVPSVRTAGDALLHSSWPRRIAAFSGRRVSAFWITGNQAVIRKQTTLAPTSSATINCTRSNRPNEARANAATPPKVIGCQGGKDVSIVEPAEIKPGGGYN